ncbi:YiiX/YebB-like N1pC/P60 family cysteine hydrolase [Microlunatus speluncae]|uniref:YiiX/YebB-like N1pC/P60 family cysteine hydrolase n=1 Tax=Microlunatus speluncae TaxID=2594267 RepID=UPI001266108F|nr:YiiX/YebB-like N1pC/P60 family cysteine hydrolase [Microlunatus speluncae]
MRTVLAIVASACAVALLAPMPALAETTTSRQQVAADGSATQAMIDRANAREIEVDHKTPITTRSPYGSYPRRKGVILVTRDKYRDLIPTGHAAIIHSRNYVVEALGHGVVRGDNNWYQSKTQAYGAGVRATSAAQDAKAADWAYLQRGKPYNYNYVDMRTRSSFYCSQLVWAAFWDNFRINLDTTKIPGAVHPLELLDDPSKAYLIYRKK